MKPLILNPAIIALVISSLLSTLYAVYASGIGLSIIRKWDMRSGSEQQLILERKTYLVSAVLAVLFGLNGFSLLLFVHTADHIHSFFVGAMCAAGSLNVNKYGYPALIVQMAALFMCGIWLILNFVDTRVPDYPLIKVKYRLLIVITVFLAWAAYLICRYFLTMRANVMTSCCGVLFNENAGGIAGQMAALSSVPAKILFYLGTIATVRTGIYFYRTGRSVYLFAVLSGLQFLVSLVAVVSFISVYFYELPTHHCPFCLLQKEYHYIGYPLYISLFTGGIAGIGAGVLEKVKGEPFLRTSIPEVQKKLCLLALAAFLLFTLLATYPMLFSDFRLEGY